MSARLTLVYFNYGHPYLIHLVLGNSRTPNLTPVDFLLPVLHAITTPRLFLLIILITRAYETFVARWKLESEEPTPRAYELSSLRIFPFSCFRTNWRFPIFRQISSYFVLLILLGYKYVRRLKIFDNDVTLKYFELFLVLKNVVFRVYMLAK